jgi:hypothetical protein
MIPDGQFLRRKHADSTQESICMTCFLIAGEGSEDDVVNGEANHSCERSALIVFARYCKTPVRSAFTNSGEGGRKSRPIPNAVRPPRLRWFLSDPRPRCCLAARCKRKCHCFPPHERS